MKNRITVAFLICVLSLLCGCRGREKEVIWENGEEAAEKRAEASDISETKAVEAAEETGAQPKLICVDICGAVARPGVYLLQEGARVYEAVELAGGLSEDANRDSVNLAQYLTDGAKIRIYSVEEAQAFPASEDAALFTDPDTDDAKGLVNLNTADAALLCTLNGIGEARARDIIAYREANGGFSSIEEIMQVSGIKEATFQKIKDKIVTE